MDVSTISLSKAPAEMETALGKNGVSIAQTEYIGSRSPTETNKSKDSLLNMSGSGSFVNPNLSIVQPVGSTAQEGQNILDSINDTSIRGGDISMARGKGYLRYKPLKYLYEVCNDKELENKLMEKSIGNPFKVKFLHDYLVYLLLQRSELMLMSCSSSTKEWSEKDKEEYKILRTAVCAVHRKLKENSSTGFHTNLFQDFRGYNYFSKEIVTKLATVFSNLP